MLTGMSFSQSPCSPISNVPPWPHHTWDNVSMPSSATHYTNALDQNQPNHQSPCGLSGSLLATTDVLQSHNWAILSPCSRLISCPWHRSLLEGRFGREHAALSWNWNSCGCRSEEKASSWCSARKNTAGQDSRPFGVQFQYITFSLSMGPVWQPLRLLQTSSPGWHSHS